MALFGKSCGASKPATAKQAKQKRQASVRANLIKKAPDTVQAKLFVICKLKGRDRDKNAKKQGFLQVLLRDPNFQDSYWELKVEDRYVSKCGTGGRWVMREKAEQEHGGGITGRTAIENGIKAGIFEERFIECGDGTQVSQVKIVEDYEETSREVSAAKKVRTSGAVTKAMLHDKMDELISGAGPCSTSL